MAFGKLRLSRSRKTSSGSDNDANGSNVPVDNEAQGITKTTSRGIIRTLTGSFSRSSHRSNKSLAGRSEYPHLHRPFNKTNLEHQKILNAFEWNFGRSSVCNSIYSGISPCASRRVSFDFDLPPSGWKDSRTRFHSESSGDESEKDHGSGTETPQVTEVETI